MATKNKNLDGKCPKIFNGFGMKHELRGEIKMIHTR